LILRVLAGLQIVLYPAVYSQDTFAEMMPALRRLSICENRCERCNIALGGRQQRLDLFRMGRFTVDAQ